MTVMYGRNESGGGRKLRRICVKVEVAVLGSPSLISLMFFCGRKATLEEEEEEEASICVKVEVVVLGSRP